MARSTILGLPGTRFQEILLKAALRQPETDSRAPNQAEGAQGG
jgi:hypothetical protein